MNIPDALRILQPEHDPRHGRRGPYLPHGAYDFNLQFDSHATAWRRARMIRQAGLEAVRKALDTSPP